MDDESTDIFRQMDAMIARMVAEMTNGVVTGMPPHAVGYRIIIQGGGTPQNPRHGRFIHPRDPHEPAPEVHRVGNEVKVVAELPGAEKESIRLNVGDGVISIEADGHGQHVTTHEELPPIDAASMRTSFKNGVLEVTFAVRDEPQADGKSAI